MLSILLKFFDDFSKNRKTREKVIIKTFAKDNVDLDYANRWNAPLFKKKVGANCGHLSKNTVNQ